ncbi:hypothetical protein Agub_g7236, partial [Astrephomene gubernaculifera]
LTLLILLLNNTYKSLPRATHLTAMACDESRHLEQLQRQIDEIEALRAMYDNGFEDGSCPPGSSSSSGSSAALQLEAVERGALSLAQQMCDAAAAAAAVGAAGTASADARRGLEGDSG